MKTNLLSSNLKKASITLSALLLSAGISAQTNVFDNVIATSPNHTYLEAALIQEGLVGALQNPASDLTVFAPDDAAFDALAASLSITIPQLLALPNLDDILTYHVLGITVPSSGITNGQIVQPLSSTNTLKLTLTSTNTVFVNQAQVTVPNLTTDNGVVHSINGVLLPYETVVDIAIDNGFTSLTAAVIRAELLPTLSNPLGTFTVFAPTNAAFDALATSLSTNIAGLLDLPNLGDILTYHVLGTEIASSGITNGAIVQPVSASNTLKLTLTSTGNVFVNQAQVTTANLNADNGIVHVLNAVVLPFETVVDVAIDNGFSTLTTAVVTAELLPALTNPFGTFTVFAPTNTAFNNFATALGTNIAGLLANPELADILLYHVLSTEVLSTALVAGPVATLNGQNINVTLMPAVMINTSNVALVDVQADNGVVHVIDAVLLPSLANINEAFVETISISPNPSSDIITLSNISSDEFTIVNTLGATVKSGKVENNQISISELEKGNYFLRLSNNEGTFQAKFIKL